MTISNESIKFQNNKIQINVELVLANRRCPRECWLRYYDPDKNKEQEYSITVEKQIPPKDSFLFIGNDRNKIIVYEKRYQTEIADGLLSADVCLCTLPEGFYAILVSNNNISYEEQKLEIAYNAYVLRHEQFNCSFGLIKSGVSGSCELVSINDHDLIEISRLISNTKDTLEKKEISCPKSAASICDKCIAIEKCLPDESNQINGIDINETNTSTAKRKLINDIADRRPLYISSQGAKVRISSERLILIKDNDEQTYPISEINQLIILGNIQVSTRTIHKLCTKGIPIIYMSTFNKFYGILTNPEVGVKNAISLQGQIKFISDAMSSFSIASSIVLSKIKNQRTIIRRNIKEKNEKNTYREYILSQMMNCILEITKVNSITELMGIEGRAAALYFDAFSKIISEYKTDFHFDTRNRRPPKDPINTMLSFGYSLLLKDLMTSIISEGLNPWIGFMHSQRSGKPALALDLMEEFRPLIVDSIVLWIISHNDLNITDFEYQQNEKGHTECLFTDEGRKKFIQIYEKRLDTKIKHPFFGYATSWRKIISLQCQILSKVLRGELNKYQGMETK